VCELNILQIPKKTLTIEKPRAYLLLTKIFFLKINKIEFIRARPILVFSKRYLAELATGKGLFRHWQLWYKNKKAYQKVDPMQKVECCNGRT
jgi:hypothetical protein